jgi:hypothetical protein
LHSINVFWDTYRQYTPNRLFFQSQTSLFKVMNPCAYCVCRRNLTAGRNLIVAPKHSLCTYHTVGNTHSRQPHAPDHSTAPLQLNVRYYSTVWRFPPLIVHLQGCQHKLQIFPFLCATLYLV